MVSAAFMLGVMVVYTLQQRTSAATAVVASTQQRQHVVDRFHQAPCPPPRQPGTKRRNLVFAAVGGKWTPDMWNFGEHASWDLVAVYFGNDSDWSCPECTLALRMPGSFKWQMLWALMEQTEPQLEGIWAGFRQRYDYVMVADDDLLMDACTLDILFASMRRHKLVAAQPSNCRGNDSDNPYWVHWQLPGLELHHVNLVEVTAPAFHMPYLNRLVRPLLQHTYSGWGLPFCFSALTHFAQNKLAAIDAACMIHPAREDVGRKMTVSERIRKGLVKPGSIYARFQELTPYKEPIEEQRAVWQMCGFTAQAARQMRQAFPPFPVIHGTVLANWSGPAARPAAAAGAAVQQQAWQRSTWLRAGVQLQLGHVLLLLLALGVSAAAGAAAAVSWDRAGRSGPRYSPAKLPPLSVR